MGPQGLPFLLRFVGNRRWPGWRWSSRKAGNLPLRTQELACLSHQVTTAMPHLTLTKGQSVHLSPCLRGQRSKVVEVYLVVVSDIVKQYHRQAHHSQFNSTTVSNTVPQSVTLYHTHDNQFRSVTWWGTEAYFRNMFRMNVLLQV